MPSFILCRHCFKPEMNCDCEVPFEPVRVHVPPEEQTGTTTVCALCGAPMCGDPTSISHCRACTGRYPSALLKASYDEFMYALRLTSGEVIEFSGAEIEGDYVHLRLTDYPESDRNRELPYTCERGIDVRVDQIVWCVDAPYGS